MSKYTTVIISVLNFHNEFKELILKYAQLGTGYYDIDDLYEYIVLDSLNRYFETMYQINIINLYKVSKDHDLLSSGLCRYIDHDLYSQMYNIKFRGRIDRVQAIVANENIILAIREK